MKAWKGDFQVNVRAKVLGAVSVLVFSLGGIETSGQSSGQQVDEVAVDELIVICPLPLQLVNLFYGEYDSSCVLSSVKDIKVSIPLASFFGDSYEAWLLGVVDNPWQTLPVVNFFEADIADKIVYGATKPFSFLDKRWLDPNVMAENVLKYKPPSDAFDFWPQNAFPIVVASL